MITFATRDANVCGKRCSALQGRMQCTAGAVAVHCEGGCSALRLRWAKRGIVIASPILIREKGGKRTPSGHYIPQDISAEPQKTIFGTRG